MTVTPEGAARALVERAAAELVALDARAAELRRRVPQAARALREGFGATRVVLFGSLAWGGFHARSDVDLAVTGVPPDRLGEAIDGLSEFVRRTRDALPEA